MTTQTSENLTLQSVAAPAAGNVELNRGNICAATTRQEEIIINAPLPKAFSLRHLFWGKRVAIVGNAVPERDCSREIDSADIVVRFNHFYNLRSGKVGKRLDVLFITPSGAWLELKSDEERGMPLIQSAKPIVAFTRFHERAKWATFQRVFRGLPYFRDENTNAANNQFTTGVSVLELISQTCENCEIRLFGFSRMDGMREYFDKHGRHYIPGSIREEAVRERLFAILPRFRIFTDAPIEEVYPFEKYADDRRRENEKKLEEQEKRFAENSAAA